LREKLRDGQSLADVAKAEGKSVEGLEQALLAKAKKRLDEAVDDGDLTQVQADEIFDRIESHIDDVVNGRVEAWHHRFQGPPDGASFWGAAA
jgi:hypothetical protein